VGFQPTVIQVIPLWGILINGIKPQSKTHNSLFPMKSIGELNQFLRDLRDPALKLQSKRKHSEGGLN
jgi:hypothetical protein